ncbi:MAG: arginine--tRNA ligase [Alphaproteobacteria bacterium]
MSNAIETIINNKIANVFEKLNLNAKFGFAKLSDRPDLSDFQCNGALALAKELGKNPREIGQMIADELSQDADFTKISVDGPGFVNMTLSNQFLENLINNTKEDEHYGVTKIEKPKKIILDFGGPNVAKEMHVGHLRTAVIGESIQRILRFIGNDVTSDVHLGDWGTQMGIVISEIIKKDGNLDKALSYNIDDIGAFYRAGNLRCKENLEEREIAKQILVKLHNGDELYRKVWRHLVDKSVEAIKENYKALDINFDLWLGESDAHEVCKDIVEIATQKGISEIDEGANVIKLPEGNKPKPPVMLQKSDGGFTYHTTDIATIKMRVDSLNAQEIIYITDFRQGLHFEQVFEASQILKIADNVDFKHIGYGTVNGQDGKPFKTRDGGVMNLETLLKISFDKVFESMPEPTQEYNAEYISNLAQQISIAGIKFQDLKNNASSGYVFDLDDFAKFEGKTGPYIQYAIARINSILRKVNFASGNIVITNPEERKLILKLLNLNAIVYRAKDELEPSIIADYAFGLAQEFSSFYASSSIANEENKEIAASRLSLAKLTAEVLTLLLNLLGIESPEIMLKKAD